MIHVLLASSLPLLVFFALWLARGRRATVRSLIVLPVACLLSGAWAVVPDMPRLWGNLALYVDMHHKRYCNVFWGHCMIDRRDDIDNSMVFPALFVLVAVAVFTVGWRELRRLERG